MIKTFLIYLPHFFDWMLKTTIMASVLVGLILCVKALLRNKLNPRWHYLLWMVLLVRLLLPWSPDSSYSIYSIISNSYKSTTSFKNEPNIGTKALPNETVVMEEGNFVPNLQQTTMESIKGTSNKDTISIEKQKDKPISFHTIAMYLWLIGVFIVGLKTHRQNSGLMNLIKKQPVITDKRILDIFNTCKESMSIQKDIPLILAGVVSNPTVFGFFRPKILLSIELINRLTEEQLSHIFYHELAHIKRRDVGFNWLMHNLLILNWFNPILWFAYICMREDQELACDAYALTFMEEEEKIPYGHTIISLLEQYSSKYYQVPSMANLSRNKRTLKRRILMIKKFKKKSYGWSAFGIIVVLGVSSLSLLNAHVEGSNGKVIEQTTEKVSTKENKSGETVYIPPIKTENFKDMTKEEILTKMLNTVDNFETAKGEYKLHWANINGADGYTLTDYELSMKNNYNAGGYSKITNIVNGKEETSYSYYNNGTMWYIKPDGTYEEEKYQEPPHQGTLKIKDAFSKDSEGTNVTKMRERPILAGGSDSLFPYEIASNYTRDLNDWEIEKQNEQLLGHNTVVIKGKLNDYARIKHSSNTFRFWIDKDTGILMKYETYNSAGNVVNYLHPTKLEINVPIDSKDFVPNLNGYKKFDRSSIENGPRIMTGNIDNEIPKELKTQWEEAKKKPNDTTILHKDDKWYICAKKGYLVDGIEVNGKEGTLLLAKVSAQKSQYIFHALAEKYKVDRLKIVYE
ncbi:transcriptional regulator [Bacillus salipaludis]|uniref:Transcriptional regulator n=1 Tax=Bacillus salipaludis TaxID=2547811 RepID=A0A4R5VSL3_9BACI|nr:M56 family metallopeptidase [Bacillus salipaludis]TDK61759.1 transcriptional regulator [Bacillus salipaludis]